jgi:hypothetical protein
MAHVERIPEIALSAAWQSGQIPENLATTDGESVRVIHRGAWTHGLGPDFADALLLFDERELRSGAVEMHLETRNWTGHGHQVDPAYNAVILHVVARHDGSQTRRADGRLVPVVEVSLPDISHLPMAMLDWDRVGGAVCAPHLAKSSPPTLREILFTLGDTRLSARSAQIEAALLDVPPAEVLWRAILGGLGYSRNQAPMRRLAESLPLATLNELRLTRPATSRFHLTLGLLLGVSGFLPLSPTEAHLIRFDPDEIDALESAWRTFGSSWHDDHLAATEWDRARVRPANHPLPRLHAAAALAHNVAPEGGLLTAVQSVLTADDPVASFCEFTRMGRMPGIGADRAIEILASAILPVVFAIGSHTDDDRLIENAASLWEKLPAPTATSVTKRAMKQVCGDAPLRGIGARGAQGLIHLDTALCLSRRCFDCPVAVAELSVTE